jgi:hypothetical protein
MIKGEYEVISIHDFYSQTAEPLKWEYLQYLKVIRQVAQGLKQHAEGL